MSNSRNTLNERLLEALQRELGTINSYIVSFKNALELSAVQDDSTIIVLLKNKDSIPLGVHHKNYDLPSNSEVAAIMTGMDQNSLDIVIYKLGGGITKIDSMSRSYDPLFYILLFPYGQSGYNLTMKKRKFEGNGNYTMTNKQMTPRDYYSFLLFSREGRFNHILRARRLMQYFFVDAGMRMIHYRLNWFKHNQSTIKAEKYQGLLDAVSRNDARNAGISKILPPSMIGSARYYANLYQNSMAIIREMGRPDLFITITTNPTWSEITSNLYAGESASDRPDLCLRVFQLKLKNLLDDLLKKHILGKVKAYMYTVEFQKRGLPHAHILLVMDDAFKFLIPEVIDKYVSAEIPDRDRNLELFQIINKNNIHDPCGFLNRESVCMQSDGASLSCAKDFPKDFVNTTVKPKNSFALYRRRSPLDGNNSFILTRGGMHFNVDNRSVVPYNLILSLKYNCHINCKVVNSVQTVKYITKYICKGSDRVQFNIQTGESETMRDEIIDYEEGKYLSTSEAMHRLLSYHIHESYPPVDLLPCHLPSQQTVFYREGEEAGALERATQTKLTAFFQLNLTDERANSFKYHEIPKYFTFSSSKEWVPKRRETQLENGLYRVNTVTRIPVISLYRDSELYYLRLLKNHVTGPKSFNDLLLFNGTAYERYIDACIAKGLVQSDRENDEVMEEACNIMFGRNITDILCTLLLYCITNNPQSLYNRWKVQMAEDLIRSMNKNKFDGDVKAALLMQIKQELDIKGQTVYNNFGFPTIGSYDISEYQLDLTEKDAVLYIDSLNEKQREIFNTIVDLVENADNRLV